MCRTSEKLKHKQFLHSCTVLKCMYGCVYKYDQRHNEMYDKFRITLSY